MKNLQEEINSIFYHVLAWCEDEGDYQPTEEEVRDEVGKILQTIKQTYAEEVLKKYLKIFKNISLNDKTPRYPYSGSKKKRENGIGKLPDRGRWLTPDEIAQNCIRSIEKELETYKQTSQEGEDE